ncbi:hypothetical protein [Brevibacillus thermoruber]|uniref:hypothetical protein n=1 Tax=Brevibacillus thermoruber TaxID=33942 RepID=UPI000429B61C|nr:hypothetical protein [Brevibacillus thermoruber]
MIRTCRSFAEASRFLPFVCLVPRDMIDNWDIAEIRIRPEGEKWATLWYRVQAKTGAFRVKQFFLDLMEPSYPDTCIFQAKGECHAVDGIAFWRGTNYKNRDSYVLSLWKTQIEISIDSGRIDLEEMGRFIAGLQPEDPLRAEEIVNNPFHALSFHTRTGKGQGEISRCRRWTSPNAAGFHPLPVTLPGTWILESVGAADGETQYVYWDERSKTYALWAIRTKAGGYYPAASWTRNYSPPVVIGRREFYRHPARGTVVHERLDDKQISYVFRGLPATTPQDVDSMFGLSPSSPGGLTG